uniref:Uncharacterized protein n=1 Tax=Trepomonas sp. PC1 TaxID=1076344 RepID=A0A146KDM7_9EUKA|eukprot:JAP93419.1 Hypothetical protein TPC1_14308 [Trepomonas sp. PC1]
MEEQSIQSETHEEQDKPRIQFEQNSQILLQIGTNGEVEINPGPLKSFQIKFRTNDQDKQNEVVVNICDGQCKISQSKQVLIKQNSSQLSINQESKQNASELYQQLYKKIE